MNGDGLDDLIVSAWAADLSDKTRAGKVPAAMADNSMALVSCLPNTTYDLPLLRLA
jgi:hypothetical protein